MKKYLFIILFSALLMPAMAEQYRLNVGQFKKISVADSVNVVYRCVADSTGTVAFDGDRKFANAIIYSVNKGELKISVATESVGDPNLPTVYVYSDYLTKATNSGTGHLNIESPAPCPEFNITLVGNGSVEATNVKATNVTAKITTGNGTIAISGKCEEANFNIVGTGTIQADNLEADVVKCKGLGGGAIGCHPLSLLKSNCLGTTKIYYKGDPIIKKRGGGKLFPIE